MRAGTYHRGGRQQSVRHLVQLGGLLVMRDFRFRYRQAYMGYVWAVARPLLAVLPLILVGHTFGLGGEVALAEYALFALSGFLLWQVFWDAVISPQWIARRLRRVFKEAPLRPETIVAAGGGLVLFNTCFYVAIFVVASVLARTLPPATLGLAILAYPVIVAAGLTIGGLFVPLTFVYLDFRFGLPLMSPLLLWTAPIIYAQRDEGFLAIVNRWNPLTYLINIPRQWLVSGMAGDDFLFLFCAAAAGALLLASLKFLRQSLPMAVQSLP